MPMKKGYSTSMCPRVRICAGPGDARMRSLGKSPEESRIPDSARCTDECGDPLISGAIADHPSALLYHLGLDRGRARHTIQIYENTIRTIERSCYAYGQAWQEPSDCHSEET